MSFSHNDLSAFIEVARDGSVSAAAVQLGITQPAVSKAVKRLENAMGVRLFERGPRGSRLTEEGRLFLEAAKRSAAQHHELTRTAIELRFRHSALLRIGITNSSSDSRAVQVIAEMMRARPGMRLKLTIGKSDVLNAAIEDRELDLAVVPSYAGQPLSCTNLSMDEDPSQVVVRDGHPLLQRTGELSLIDLAPFDWVMASASSVIHKRWLEIFDSYGVSRPTVALEAEYMSDAVMGIMTQTNHLAMVPGSVLRNWLGRVRLLKIPTLNIHRTTVLLAHPKAPWTPLMLSFKEMMSSS